jgi:hypothetical protein
MYAEGLRKRDAHPSRIENGQRKRAKLQWLQDPKEINVDNLNNERCKARRLLMNKEKEYLN